MHDVPETEPLLDTAGLVVYDPDEDMPINPDMPVEEGL
jgi:hypothetical protein